jgi:hypothetical protein
MPLLLTMPAGMQSCARLPPVRAVLPVRTFNVESYPKP